MDKIRKRGKVLLQQPQHMLCMCACVSKSELRVSVLRFFVVFVMSMCVCGLCV